jgi:hypothetical protein
MSQESENMSQDYSQKSGLLHLQTRMLSLSSVTMHNLPELFNNQQHNHYPVLNLKPL